MLSLFSIPRNKKTALGSPPLSLHAVLGATIELFEHVPLAIA
jgi:hypothetical protein